MRSGKDQNKAAALLEDFGSLDQPARASVQELLPFVSGTKAASSSALWVWRFVEERWIGPVPVAAFELLPRAIIFDF